MYVTNRGSNTVTLIDLHDFVVKQQIPVWNNPQGLVRNFQNLFVVNQNNGGPGSVSVLKRADFRHAWDLGGDGRADLTWLNASTKQTAAWLMSGVAPTASAIILGASDWAPLVRNDIDGDGKGDIVWRNLVTNETAAWFMDGLAPKPGAAGVILGPSTYVPLFSNGCAGTIARCLLWRDSVSGNVVYWYMPNGLVPTYTQSIYAGGPGWVPALNANFNGDGHGDIVWQHADGSVAIWLMQGDPALSFSVLASAVILGPGTGWVPEIIGDFDGDARSDILWRNATTGDTAIWLMNGLVPKAGGTAVILPGALGWTATHLRDLDGDQKSDILWRHTSGATALWLMDGLVSKPAGAVTLLSDPNWAITHTLDTNNDLKGDLLWRSTTGQTAIWAMDGPTATSTAILSSDPNWVVVPLE
jgi:YVTN family beta-propeller protein